ncbi:hypothetical protein [Hahella sp. HN01]|uniref:hypothetical protein n=1 Tax=Hahella sp. HN01 TaxID=2847262 RepID=UPI001C1EBAE9|nr:hypothetical protein [Hahella sp. HN01]MBU6952740.1 hypothetical protein [Hahella sp. HN01]
MRAKMDWRLRSIVVGLIVSVTGCSTTVSIKGEFAPRVLAGENIRHIAIFDFSGPDGAVTVKELESLLIEARSRDIPYFKIMDHSVMKNLTGRYSRNANSLDSTNKISSIGRTLGVEGVLLGEVTQSGVHKVKEKKEVNYCSSRNDKGKCTRWSYKTIYCDIRTATFTVIPKLIDVEKSRIVYSKSYSGNSTASSCDYNEINYSDNGLVAIARKNALQDIRLDMAPYHKNMDVIIKSDDDTLSDVLQEKFKGAVEFAEANRMDRACNIWRGMYYGLIPTGNYNLLYNLGVCEEFEGSIACAQALYRRADNLLVEPDEDINEGLRRTRLMLEQQRVINLSEKQSSDYASLMEMECPAH